MLPIFEGPKREKWYFGRKDRDNEGELQMREQNGERIKRERWACKFSCSLLVLSLKIVDGDGDTLSLLLVFLPFSILLYTSDAHN